MARRDRPPVVLNHDRRVVRVTCRRGSELVSFESGDLSRDDHGAWLYLPGAFLSPARVTWTISAGNGRPPLVAVLDRPSDASLTRVEAILARSFHDADPRTLHRSTINDGDDATTPGWG